VSPPAAETRAALFSLEYLGIKLGLEQIRALVMGLGGPDRAFPSIIIAGTNGKGSVSAMVERGLRAAGYRTGRYTSPHLVAIEERFAVDGVSIEPDVFDRSAARVLAVGRTLPAPPSFFEATTAIALDVFRDARVDVAVLEVGLGGRLDATNVVSPVAVGITAIDFDHEQYLGHTLAAIAAEKAGVIKPGAFVVAAENAAEADAVIAAACQQAGAPLIRASEAERRAIVVEDGRVRMDLVTPHRTYGALRVGLRGRHQAQNATVAVRLLEELAARGSFALAPGDIRTGVEAAIWPARLESGVVEGVPVLLDGAHNPGGARALAAFLDETYGRPLPIVLGVMRDKQVNGMLAALAPHAARFIFTAPAVERALAPEALVEALASVAPDVPAETAHDPRDAVRRAAAFGSPVVVAGSLYLAGEIRACFP
jgi:dihydrofolate synthase/folylpolyglutamate synthase